MVVNLELIDGITHCFCPKTMCFGNCFHLVNEIVVDDDALDLKAVGERGKSGNRNECYLDFCFIPVCIFHGVRLEGDFGTEFCRDLLELANGVAGSDFIFVDFEKGGRAVLVEHVADDGDKFIFVIVDRGGLVYQTDLLLPGDEKEGGDLVWGDALPKFARRPEGPVGIDFRGGFRSKVEKHLFE